MARRKENTLEEMTREFAPLMEELHKASDRGVILMASAYLEHLLGATLRAVLACGKERTKEKKIVNDLLNRTLHSFADRINLVYGLGIIGPVAHANLDTIRDIRNRHAAHTYLPVAFDDPAIRQLCKKLEVRVPSLLRGSTELRERFIIVVALLVMELAEQRHVLKHPKPKDPSLSRISRKRTDTGS